MNARTNCVEIRILQPGAETPAIQNEFETWFVKEGDDLVFLCPLRGNPGVDEQLKWFHGMLEFKRKYIRRLEAKGVSMVVRIYITGRSLFLQPESLFLGHHLHLKTEIHLNP